MKLLLFVIPILIVSVLSHPEATSVAIGSVRIPHISIPVKHPDGRSHLPGKNAKLHSKTHSASKTHHLTIRPTPKKRPARSVLWLTLRTLRKGLRRRKLHYREIPPNPNTIASHSTQARQWNSMFQETEHLGLDSISCLAEKWQC